MTKPSAIRNAVSIIAASVALAWIFNFLFFEKAPGVSAALFAVMLLGAVSLFGVHQHIPLHKNWWLQALIIFFALMPAIRANEFLTFLNICATLGLLMLLAHELAGTPAFLMRLRDYLLLVTLVPLRMLGRALSTVTLLSQAQSEIKRRDAWARVLKGIIMAVPVLIIFGVLFSQADLAFARFINSFVNITISEQTAQYCALFLVAFVAALSFLSYIFFSPAQAKASREKSTATPQPGLPAGQAGKSIEVMVFLGLIGTLFLLFIGFQLTYLFGGEANIVNAGFTYAEYARHGFWELLAVALLSLVILLAAEKYTGVESASWRRDKRFLLPALILIAEVGVVIASAAKRLSLYIDAYSLTTLRFYVAGFIVLLIALFALLAYKFIASKREEFFTFGTLLSVAAFLIAMNLVNPDAFVARVNFAEYHRTGKIDAVYIGKLSADAAPWKIELYNTVADADKATLQELFQKQKDTLEKINANWQSANLSRARALQVLQGFLNPTI